jgi:hypothetical protein
LGSVFNNKLGRFAVTQEAPLHIQTHKTRVERSATVRSCQGEFFDGYFLPIHLLHVFVKHTHNYQVLKRFSDPGLNMNKPEIVPDTNSINFTSSIKFTGQKYFTIIV